MQTSTSFEHHIIQLSRIWGSYGGEYEDGDRPDDGGSKDLWNDGKLLPDYTALQPRRQPSSSYNLLEFTTKIYT
jgi:hypothetical protein